MFTHQWTTNKLNRMTEIITEHGGRIISVCPQPPHNEKGGMVAGDADRHRVYFEVKDRAMFDVINTATLDEWPS